MGVLENLKKLEKTELNQLLKSFKIKSNGNTLEDIFNLEKFYFENVDILYSHLPISTYEFLEMALNPNSEKIFKEEFEAIGCFFEDLGLSDTTISDIVQQEISLANKYIAENDLGDCLTKDVMKNINEMLEKNGFIHDEEFNKKYFEALDKEIGTVIFKFLKENKDLREEEVFIFNLIKGMTNLHGALDIDDISYILEELKITFNYNQINTFINFKVPNVIFEKNTLLIVDNKNLNDYCLGDFIKNNIIKEVHSLETYLQV